MPDPTLAFPHLCAAKALAPVREHGADNHGEMVELMLEEVGAQAGDPWCAAALCHAGYWAYYNPVTKKSSWPLPRTAGCQVIADACKKLNILVETPQVGDGMLMWFPGLKRFAHTGWVMSTGPEHQVVSLDGNTNDDGSRNGWKFAFKTRTLDPAQGHRFFRLSLIPGWTP